MRSSDAIAMMASTRARHLPAGQDHCRCRSAAQLFDGAIPGVASAAMWHDYLTVNGDRLTLSFAKAAVKHGAALANYTEAIGPLEITSEGSRQPDGTNIRYPCSSRGQCRRAVGRRASRCTPACGRGWPLLKAMNLVTSRPARDAALVGGHAERARARAAALARANAGRHQRIRQMSAARTIRTPDAPRSRHFSPR